MLWASRLCAEKRPDLLLQIVSAVRNVLPQVEFDAAGNAKEGEKWINDFQKTDGLNYLGPFDTFDSLKPDKYDAFLYTSAFDGLPNVILEAMAFGLPVIAPEVGGVGEAVENGKSGWLIPQVESDEVLVASYVAAIVELYQNIEHSQALGLKGRAMILERHSPEQYRKNVNKIFS